MRNGIDCPHFWEEAKKHLFEVDETISKLIRAHEHPSLSSRDDIFLTLVRSVVGQQISSKAADSVWGRIERFLESVNPESVLEASLGDLRDCGLSAMKAEYIVGIAESWRSGYSDVDWNSLSDEEASTRLIRLRGVGHWTAQMILIFSLLRPDVFPVSDIGIIRSMEALYNQGHSLTESELLTLADRWRPYRTVATWYLWRSLDPIPVNY